MDPYYSRPEVSNSDVSFIDNYFKSEAYKIDLTRAYANGNLIDAMITEQHLVDYFKLRLTNNDYQFSQDEFEIAKQMKKSFYANEFCKSMVKHCAFQYVSIRPNFQIEHNGIRFSMDARAKWDLFCKGFDLSGDIKSTSCTTKKQCIESLYHFDYDRSRAWYMDLENRSNDILIFISKVNFEIFTIPVKRGEGIYNSGKEKYQEKAFKYWYLLGDINKTA